MAANRTVLFLRCSGGEAMKIHGEAEAERRTVSAYVLSIVLRNLTLEERAPRAALLPWEVAHAPGSRTAMLLRCSIEESDRIRAAAKRRSVTITGYILRCLRRSWYVREHGTIAG